MFVKKFEAASIEEALSKIKQELGPNALILASHEKKGKWFNKPGVEVTAAFAGKVPAKIAEEEGFDEQVLRRIFPHRKPSLAPVAAAPAKEAPPAPRKETVSKRYVEVGEPPVENNEKKGAAVSRERAERFENQFLRWGFSQTSSREFSRRLVFDYPKSDTEQPQRLAKIQTKLVAAGLRTLSREEFESKGSWTVIGTPGVGKTSLLVKLALHLKSVRRPAALLSCDKRKLTGRSELASYARLIKVPFYSENNASATGARIVLVDSPSLSPSEQGAELEKICKDRAVLLVLDPMARLAELLRIVEGARRFSPTAIAFTRIDLAVEYGVIHDVLKAARLPLLGLSVSQSFSTPFRFFDPASLSKLILNCELE